MSRARPLTFVLLLGACSQPHLSIGGDDLDARVADPADASTRLHDASTDATAVDGAVLDARVTGPSGALTAQLRAFERDNIENLTGGCGAPCVDLDIVIDGGVPPYQVTWPDQVVGSHRRYCPGANNLTDSELSLAGRLDIFVNDAADAGLSVGPYVLFAPCADDDAGAPSSWSVCFHPTLIEGVACDDETLAGAWYTLEAPLDAADTSFSAAVAGITLFTQEQLDLVVTSTLCGEERASASMQITYLNGSVSTSATVSAPPAQYVLVRAPNQPDGKLPGGLAIDSVLVCFTP